MRISNIKIVLLPLFAVVSLCSCSEDNSPFSGEDSYISSFQLKQGDSTLNAAVSDGHIVLTAPEDLSLEGAAATVVISENAHIEPNPLSVTNWNEAQTFVVTAHNGTKNSYRYSVQRSAISKDGDITLLNQADVDALGALNLTQLNGSLTIGAASGQDSIYSLTPLESLKIIKYGLTIHATYAGEELEGLKNVETIGSLQIVQNTTLKTVEFPKLISVMSDLVLNKTKVKTLRFPELLNIDKGFSITSSETLTVMEFPKLKNIVENLTLTEINASLKLTEIDFPALEKVGGNISISNWKKVVTLHMPKLEVALGSVSVSYNTSMSTMDLSSLQRIGGDCKFTNNSALESFDGLKSLSSIGGELLVCDMPKLKSIQGWKALTSVGGRLYLANWPVLDDEALSGLSNLNKVGGDIIISQIPFNHFTGFMLSNAANMQISNTSVIQEIDLRNLEITGTLTLSDLTSSFVVKGKENSHLSLIVNGSVPIFEGFSEVKSLVFRISSRLQNDISIPFKKVTGDVNISIYNFDNFSMPDLEEIGGKFTLSIHTGLQTVNFPLLKTTGATTTLDIAFLPSFTLPALETINGNCAITSGKYQGDNLADLQMPSLAAVNGILSIEGSGSYYPNSKLTDLNGFSALKSVKGITVSWNTGLTDFTGLKNALPAFTTADWTISNNSYNPTYQDMLDGKYIKP